MQETPLLRIAYLAISLVLFGAPRGAAEEVKPKDLIVGKWETTDQKDQGTVEFLKDGTMHVVIKGGPTLKGTYKFLEDEVMEVELDIMGQKLSQKLRLKVTKDELVTTDEAKKADTFKRIK